MEIIESRVVRRLAVSSSVWLDVDVQSSLVIAKTIFSKPINQSYRAQNQTKNPDEFGSDPRRPEVRDKPVANVASYKGLRAQKKEQSSKDELAPVLRASGHCI